jgi:formylglycine-generating enzyme required for sulfatase activity
MRKQFVLSVVLFLALVFAGWAQTGGSRYALVIGNADYRNVGKLTNPVNDAKDIAAALQRLGYQVDLQLDVDQGKMIDAIDTHVRRLSANRESEGFFWFAGHGVQICDENYLLPVDVAINSERRVQSSAYSLNDLLMSFEEAHNRVNIMILDACRNNPLPATARSGANRGLAVVNDVPTDLFVMFSTAPGDVAQDGVGKRNSPFAEAFLKHINSTETISLMATDVISETMQMTNMSQRPFTRGSIISDKYYSLNKSGGGAPPVGPSGRVSTGSIAVSSGVAGIVMIDGVETSTLVKANGTAIIENVTTGDTEVAVKTSDGRVVRAPQPVLVRQGQSVATTVPAPERPVPDGMVRIRGGTFMMGSPASEASRENDEVQHRVTVGSFYMGKHEVMQKEYQAMMGSNPSYSKGDALPVEQINWFDAIEYCNKRSQREGLTAAYTISGSGDNRTVTWNRNANGYRLPTEAEWEYACRAGSTTPFSTGSNITTNQANYDGNYPYNGNAKGTYREKTTVVGSFAANAWGLYDMHGNVWEWCWDWYGAYSSGAQTDPMGVSSGSLRVSRGGNWFNLGQYLRSAGRDYLTPSYRIFDIGFRLLRPSV